MFNQTFELQLFQFLITVYLNSKYIWNSNVKHCKWVELGGGGVLINRNGW